MDTKYEFVSGDTINCEGATLTRIRALRDIPQFSVKAGDLGGYLQSEHNLSHEGSAWVSDSARVSGSAQVSDSAQVSGDARVSPIYLTGLAWSVTITDDHMQIGCQFHAIEAWGAFTDAEITQMDGKDALRFWRENKDALMPLARNHAKKAAEAK